MIGVEYKLSMSYQGESFDNVGEGTSSEKWWEWSDQDFSAISEVSFPEYLPS
jgi:hypothetical protein